MPGSPGDAYATLLSGDPVLRAIAAQHGQPDPFGWDDGGRTGSSAFAALVLHIVSQQISTAVALGIYDRLREATGGIPTPAAVAGLDHAALRALGMSGAKADYVHELARQHVAGLLDSEQLGDLPDDEAVARLTAVRGIGQWTAQMFLISQLRRPDVLPSADLGIRHAVAVGWQLPATPTVREVDDRGRAWAPFRTYAAALLWASLRPVTGVPEQPFPVRALASASRRGAEHGGAGR